MRAPKSYSGQKLFHFLLEPGVKISGKKFGKESPCSAHAVGNKHLIVVEHHQQIRPQMTRVLQALKSYATGDGTIIHDGNDFVALLQNISRRRKSQGR